MYLNEREIIMNLKKVTISYLVLLAIILTGCSKDMRPAKELEKYTKIIEDENFDKLSLTIYYINPTILTRAPLSVDQLIKYNNVNKIVISGSELKEHIDLLKQINKDVIIQVKKNTRLNARLYYVFETEEGKVLDVAMWGDDNSVFVNGFEVKWNDVFLDIIKPFLTQEAKDDLKSYFENSR